MTTVLICGQLMSHPLNQLFHLSNLLQCQSTIEWSMLSSWATSPVFVRRSLSMILSVGCCQLPMAGHYAPSRLSSPLQNVFFFFWQNVLNHYCIVCSLAVPGPKVLPMLQVVSAALWPILNLNKKVAQICLLSNIISMLLLLLSRFSRVWLCVTP